MKQHKMFYSLRKNLCSLTSYTACYLYSICFALHAGETKKDDQMTLVWSDEFNKDGPVDEKSWVHETGFVRNNELQWYQAANATCRGGMLIIEARREQVPNPEFQAGSNDWRKKRKHSQFTSACIKTIGKHEWRYGRFEVRARIPVAQGTWPAIWTLGHARNWPACGEVDIMECYKDTLLANLAWGTKKAWTPKWKSTKTKLSEFGKDWAQSFHTWRMDWDEQSIKISVDDRVLNTANLDKCKNPDGTEPFREPHYLLLNLAIGGDAAGDPGNTSFPQRYEIDWVRVYQKK